jgi:tellurite resistance protein
MGIFEKVLGKETGTVSLTKPEAFAAVGVATVGVDGDISLEEVQRVVADITTLGAFRGYDIDDLVGTLDKVSGLIQKRGTGPIFSAVKAALTKEELKAAFFLAADLALADGVVEPEEKGLLEDLQTILQLDDETALKIVEVAVIKNSG